MFEGRNDSLYCSQLTHPDDTPPKLERFVLRFHPRGCLALHFPIFTAPGAPPSPPLVATGAMPMGSDRAGDSGWTMVPTLLHRLMGKHPLREVKATAKVGSATRLFHSPDPPFPLGMSGSKVVSFLAWRSGNTLAVVMVGGKSYAEVDSFAAEMASRQQAHIAKPTPYTRAERFSGEVALDDPALTVPVYWLGRNFKPGHGLPSNRLWAAFIPRPPSKEDEEAATGFEEAPGSVLAIDYEELRLNTWTAATWPQYTASKVGHALTHWKCTETRTIALPGGSATIYAGYGLDYRKCPKRAPEAFTAWVQLGDTFVVAESPICPRCVNSDQLYGSYAGMEAIARTLRLRPKPVY